MVIQKRLQDISATVYGFFASLRKKLSSPVVIFSTLALIFGSLIIILTPPFAGGDEEAHFVRAYGISRGDFVVQRYEPVTIPQSYSKTIGCIQTGTPTPGKLYQYKWGEYGNNKGAALACALSVPLDRPLSEGVETTAQNYSPTTYLPQVIAITIGKLFNLPIIVMMYLARIFVMLAYVAMIAFAIKIVPVRKWALVGVALLPYSLMHVVNPGGDYMIYGSIAIFVATIIRSMYLTAPALRKEHPKLLALLVASGAFMVLPKGIIPGILFLPLIIFYGGLRAYKPQKAIAFSIIAAIGIAWQKIVGNNAVEMPEAVGGSVASFPYAFVKTMLYGWTGHDLLYNGSGGPAGVPSIIVSLVNFMIAAYIIIGYAPDDKKIVKNSKLQQTLLTLGSIGIATAVIVGSFAAMHIVAFYLQKGTNIIQGVQIRYFYPALFMLAIVPFSRPFTSSEKTFRRLVIGGSIIALSATVLTLLLNFKWGIFRGLFM